MIGDLTGIVTVLNTPFNAGGAPDLDALTAHVHYALDSGVAGFLVPAMASEVEFLSREERNRIVQIVVKSVGSEVPVIGGASAPPEDRLDVVHDLMESGCDGILISLPFVDEASYRRDVEAVAAEGMDYLMIQDWDPRGFGVPVELIADLFATIPAFRCLKIEVVPAGAKYSRVKEATGGSLAVAGGWAVMHLIDGLDRGVDVFMPTALHELYVGIVRLYRSGRREEAVDWFRRLLPILTFSNQHLDISISFFKRLMYRQGYYSSDMVRCPAGLWDDFNRRRGDELIDEALVLIEEMRARRGTIGGRREKSKNPPDNS